MTILLNNDMISDSVKKLFLTKYENIGNERFYKFLINYALDKMATETEEKKIISVEIELIEYYEKFLQLYRRENNELYMEIAKQFRRAANKIYRVLLKKGDIEKNNRFLNTVE